MMGIGTTVPHPSDSSGILTGWETVSFGICRIPKDRGYEPKIRDRNAGVVSRLG